MELSTIFGVLAGIGTLAAGLGFAYAQFTQGSGRAKDDLIGTLNQQLNIEKEKTKQLELQKNSLVTSHQTQINELTKQIGVLQGTVDAYNVKIKEYTDILQGRSPEQTAFMTFMTETAKETSQVLKNIQESLQKIDGRVSNSEKAIIKIIKEKEHGNSRRS